MEFVESAWVTLDDPDLEESYFYNDITGQITWTPPGPGAALEVVPSMRSVLGAGRSDLHNALKFHGGYTAVAAELGWPRSQRWAGRHLVDLEILSAELASIQAELDWGGGAGAEGKNEEEREEDGAAAIQLADERSAKSEDELTPAAAAAAVADVPTRMPSKAEVLSLGRTDVAGAVARLGGFAAVAEQLGLDPKKRVQNRCALLANCAGARAAGNV